MSISVCVFLISIANKFLEKIIVKKYQHLISAEHFD